MYKLGIITYAHPHLKTEQVLLALYKTYSSEEIIVFALPFKQKQKKDVFFNHRPEQSNAISPDVLCQAYNIAYKECRYDTEISNNCDIYLITGAGILSESMLVNKKVINVHPGIIPAARGLDSFKWSIHNFIPLGVTMHYIDKHIDMGEIIYIVPTPVFITDSIETLARRHYENEISLLSFFFKYLDKPFNGYKDIKLYNPQKKMPFETEVKMARAFNEYKKCFAHPYFFSQERNIPPYLTLL